MKSLILVAVCFMLAGCFAPDKCVRVEYYDYGEGTYLQHVYQFRGTYAPYKFWVYDGIVTVKQYLGEGSPSMFEQCPSQLTLKGHYPVMIDEGQGVWILTGLGDGTVVDVYPNHLSQKALDNVRRELK